MKYKLINKQTNEEHLCDKVTIDGFDYYVNDEAILTGDYKYHHVTGLRKALVDGNYTNQKKVIATNNPNIDISKVIDEAEELANEYSMNETKSKWGDIIRNAVKFGHNKSKETHPFSEEDMLEFGKFCIRQFTLFQNRDDGFAKRILPEWKEQQLKTIYYE